MLPASLIILVTRRLAIILVRRVSPWRRSSPNAVPTLGWRQLLRFPVLSIPDAATALVLPLMVLLNVDQVFVPVPLAARALRPFPLRSIVMLPLGLACRLLLLQSYVVLCPCPHTFCFTPLKTLPLWKRATGNAVSQRVENHRHARTHRAHLGKRERERRYWCL